MTEIDPPSRESAELGFVNTPYAAMGGFLDPSNPSNSSTLSIIRASYQGFGGRRDALGVCIDLAQRITNPTTVLAEMFAANSTDIPQHWKDNPEIKRTVLTMSGHVELGYLRAQQVAQAYEGSNPHIDARIAVVEGFVTALQAK